MPKIVAVKRVNHISRVKSEKKMKNKSLNTLENKYEILNVGIL